MPRAPRLLLGIVAVCVMAIPAQAQAPSDPPSFGGRVEVTEHGVAVTFPQSWLAFDLTGDIDARVADIEAARGNAFRGGRAAAVQELSRLAERRVAYAYSPDGTSCELRILSARRVDLLDPAYVAELDAALGAEPAIKGYTGAAPVDLPGGPALRYAWEQLGVGPGGADVPHVGYMVDGGAHGAVLTCEGPAEPGDGWASIAETIEFIAPTTGLPLAGLGGRVADQRTGIALTFPADWVWARTSEASTDRLVERIAELVDPVHAEARRFMLADVADASPLVGWSVAKRDLCVVGVYPTTRSFDELVDGLVAMLAGDGSAFPGGADVTEVELAGRAGARLDFVQADPELPHAVTHYLLVEDGVYAYVSCMADVAPPDRWWSIAGTLELLPATD
jgi:hypothetical protein